MKNFICIGLLFLAASAFSQTQQGGFLVGGQVSAAWGRTEVPSTNFVHRTWTTDISPNLMFFALDNLAIGLQPSWQFSRTFQEDDYQMYDIGSRTLSIGPVARYYFRFGKFGVFPEAGFAARWNHSETRLRTDFGGGDPIPGEQELITNTTNHAGWLGAGFTFFVRPHLGIETLLKYTSLSKTEDVDTKTHEVRIGVGIHAYLFRD